MVDNADHFSNFADTPPKTCLHHHLNSVNGGSSINFLVDELVRSLRSDYRRSMQALVSKPLRPMAPGTRTADENLHKIGNIVLPLELNGFHPIVAVFLSAPHNSQALP